MGEVRFRGKRLFDGEWAYGYLWKDDVTGDAFIKDGTRLGDSRVDPETIEMVDNASESQDQSDEFAGNLQKVAYKPVASIPKAMLHVMDRKRLDAMDSYGKAARSLDDQNLSYQGGVIAGLDKAMSILGYQWAKTHYQRMYQ